MCYYLSLYHVKVRYCAGLYNALLFIRPHRLTQVTASLKVRGFLLHTRSKLGHNCLCGYPYNVHAVQREYEVNWIQDKGRRLGRIHRVVHSIETSFGNPTCYSLCEKMTMPLGYWGFIILFVSAFVCNNFLQTAAPFHIVGEMTISAPVSNTLVDVD